jgi:hypothetical protein
MNQDRKFMKRGKLKKDMIKEREKRNIKKENKQLYITNYLRRIDCHNKNK